MAPPRQSGPALWHDSAAARRPETCSRARIIGATCYPPPGRTLMPRLDRLAQISRNTLLALPVRVNDTAPFTVPSKPLAACRLALVTTAGLHRRGDRRFDPGDQTYRVIPADTPASEILQSHTSLGFDR